MYLQVRRIQSVHKCLPPLSGHWEDFISIPLPTEKHREKDSGQRVISMQKAGGGGGVKRNKCIRKKYLHHTQLARKCLPPLSGHRKSGHRSHLSPVDQLVTQSAFC